MLLERYLQIIAVSLEAVFLNKNRSILTALGIIFGVAAVIAMMAIGNGARQEILEQIKLVGLNNIVILPTANGENSSNNDSREDDQTKSLQKQFIPGLNLKDAESIQKNIPTVLRISPEIIYSTLASREGKKTKVDLTGISPDFFRIFNLSLKSGSFFDLRQVEAGAPVCILGAGVAARLFPDKNPLGQQIKCGTVWLRVIGIIRGPDVDKKTENMGISDYNHSVFAPIKSVLLRYKDRTLINQAALMGGGSQIIVQGGSVTLFSSGQNNKQAGNENQVDKIVVQVKESQQLSPTAMLIGRMLKRRHQGKANFEIKIPELLLKQEQKTKDIFNIVLGAIAGISLLVGGIGIMNIMLASVMERIREIGVRRATGATQKDIVLQFLAESVFISISGGIIGILLGVIMAKLITLSTGILTIVSFWSIVLSFGVAAAVGIIFGYLPAKKAAELNPVDALRHD